MRKMVQSAAAFAAVLLTSTVALAAPESYSGQGGWGWMSLAIGLGIGLAAMGGAMAQGKAASAALEGIARNPNAGDKVFVPMILGLAFIESLVLFTWVLMFLLMGKF